MARLCQERPYGFRFNTSPQEQHQAGYDNSRGPVSEREEHFFYFFFLSCCLTAKHGERPQPDKPNPPASTASRHGVTHGW